MCGPRTLFETMAVIAIAFLLQNTRGFVSKIHPTTKSIGPHPRRLFFSKTTATTTTTTQQQQKQQRRTIGSVSRTTTTPRYPRRLFSTTSTSSSSSDSSSSSSTKEAEAGATNNRLPRNGASLDVRTIVNELDMVLSHLASRRASEETKTAAKEISELQAKRVAFIKERDERLNQRNTASATIGKLMQMAKGNPDENLSGDDKATLAAARETSVRAGIEAEKTEADLELVQTQIDGLLNSIPNLLDDRVPDGSDDTDNEEILVWGDIHSVPSISKDQWKDSDNENEKDFEPLWHDDVATRLGGYKAEEAVKMSGARFVALTGSVARLERAIAMFLLDLHTSTEHGYTEATVPYIVGRSALQGTGQLPKFEDDLFAITNKSHTCNGEDAFLIPTAEVPLTNMHRDAGVLAEDDLPISYVSYTPCFRAEAGSYGRDTKGLIRTHQFHKVELVKITTPEDSDEEHESLTQHAENCLRQLELPYRKVRLCSGDIGFGARHCYDLEVWCPGAKEYREISSCSNTGDFQARRIGLRYRPNPPPAAEAAPAGGKKKNKKQKKPKPVLCHTINGSGLAVGRTLVAVLENYQQPDGTVVVPKVLRPYMGGTEVLEPPAEK